MQPDATPPEASRLRILVRQSPDWRNTPYQELLDGSREFCRLVGAAAGISENFISDVVAVWDRTFAMSFFEVRAAMKEIAERNLATIANASVTSLASMAATATAERLCLFVDDDDWLHPDIAALLQPHIDDSDGYIFGNLLCVSRVELRRVEDGCYTNNYAVSSRFLEQRNGDLDPFVQHWDAHAIFHKAGFRRRYVPLYLSATNKHPASTMKLKDGLQNDPLCAATLRSMVEKFLGDDAPTPAEAAWVQPYRECVREVFARLL